MMFRRSEVTLGPSVFGGFVLDPAAVLLFRVLPFGRVSSRPYGGLSCVFLGVTEGACIWRFRPRSCCCSAFSSLTVWMCLQPSVQGPFVRFRWLARRCVFDGFLLWRFLVLARL